MSSPSAALLPEAVVYGTVCLDRFVRVDLEGNAPSDPDALQDLPGGEAFNTATLLTGWGVRVLLTGTAIGSDAEGNRLRDLLDTSPLGLSRTHIPDDPEAVTPVCTIRVFPDGERQMRGRGFAQAVAPPPLPAEILAARPLFVTDPNLGEAALIATRAAHAAGCSILSMDFDAVPGIVAISRILVTSQERLARQQTGETAEETVRRLQAAGAQTAIVTLGAEGCLVADRDAGFFHHPAFSRPDICDTTGAGDAFRAGLAYGLLHALPLPELLRFASAAAALHCTVLGGGSRIPLKRVQSLVASPF